MKPVIMPAIGLSLLLPALAACAPDKTDAPQLTFATQYACGGAAIEIGMLGDVTTLRADGRDYQLVPVETASGAKYAVAGDRPETSFWSKGDAGVLVLEGHEHPECLKTGGYAGAVEDASPPAAVWRARGNEPGWSLTIEGGEMTLLHDYGAQTFTAPAPEPEVIEGGRRYTSETGVMVATVLDKLCADVSTGVPYPETVSVAYGEQVFQGCGGDPQDVLAGAAWVVEDIGGAGVIDGARVDLVFDPGAGQITGKAGCNTYTATYTLTGEGLSVEPPVSTEMACAEAIMNQERRFLDALGAVHAYSVDETGALRLEGSGGAGILARR